MREEAHLPIDCVLYGGVGGICLIDNLSAENTPREIVENSYTALIDIQRDLESFTFGLSELYMLADEQSEFAERIVLLKKCVEDAKNKVDKLMK